jgi:hypothetical protein
MISLSFEYNLSVCKAIMKMLADKTNLKNIKPAYDKLAKVDKKFAEHFKEDQILTSM